MPRTQGAKGAAHAQRRAALLARLRERLSEPGAMHASWRQLAAAAGVSLSTMTLYFGDRAAVVRAMLEDQLEHGGAHLAAMARPEANLAASVRGALHHLTDGLSHGGLSRSWAMSLAQCLRHPALGPAFLDNALEPTLRAVEQRLQAHIDRGEMRGGARPAALMLVAPLLLAHLHQSELGGSDTRPLDLDGLIEDQATAFLRAFSP